MMNLAICDDDNIFCEELKNLLLSFFKKRQNQNMIIDVYNSGDLLYSSNKNYDIVFLDIEMPGTNGINIASKLIKKNPKLIFFIISSYPQYLDDALHFHAFRYLSKPLDSDRLLNNLIDALYVINTNYKKILIETKDRNIIEYTSNIIMLEVVKQKTIIHLETEDIVNNHPLNYWINTLTGLPFFQTHKSYIVNFAHVTGFDKNLVHLSNEHVAYLTQRKYTDFKRNYMIYIDTTI